MVFRLGRFLGTDLWRVDATRTGLAARSGVTALRLVVVIVRASQDTALNLHAMGLVYSTLLSLVPLLAVSFSLLKAFGAHYRIEPLLLGALEPLGARAGEVTRRVVEFVDNMQVGVLGAVGLAGLLYTVLALIERIEGALNDIWRVRRARGLARKFSSYISILLVGPVLVFAALALIASAQSHWLVQRLIALAPVEAIAIFVTANVMPFVLLWAAFSFLYSVAPNTWVRPPSALLGGAVAAALWQFAGTVFAAVVAGSARYTAIYSGFAALVVFLIWLYIGWLIVLIGGQVAYFHQHPSSYLAARRPPGVSFRERVALGAVVEIARRSLDGRPPPRLGELATTLAAPVTVLEDLVDDLVARGVLLRAAEPEGVALARPPDHVTVADVLAVVHDPERQAAVPPAAVDDAVAAALEARDRAVAGAVGSTTLAALASRADQPPVAVASLVRARR
ncbi:MAG TPA: YhjD/YihY/BrkB family envelope integrity protein [Candidatus Tectomicrobia bacterium]|nr:YhjD/YihY/BrkB family envelope integrity protein [Candidatus Tectomicrobia bacterium]